MTSRQPLDDPEELLHRQVHPSFLQNGRVSSQAFRPTPKDDGELSVSRASLTTAEAAYQLYTEEKKLQSVGVWSVTVGECEGVGLKAFADPLEGPPPDPAHAVIDFRHLGTNAVEKASSRLAAVARARGRQYPAEEPGVAGC